MDETTKVETGVWCTRLGMWLHGPWKWDACDDHMWTWTDPLGTSSTITLHEAPAVPES